MESTIFMIIGIIFGFCSGCVCGHLATEYSWLEWLKDKKIRKKNEEDCL